jgi:hypothetical protein
MPHPSWARQRQARSDAERVMTLHGFGRAFAAAAFIVACVRSGASMAQPPETAREFLARTFELTAADMNRVAAGHVLSRTLTVKDSREVASLGVARMKVTPEFFVEQLSRITEFKKGEAVAQIGTFSRPADLRDIQGLTLEDGDVRSLAECRVGDCRVQLPAGAIDRLRREVDWRRSDSVEHANAVVRRVLVEYVATYQRSGPSASMRYADGREVLDVQREFESLAETFTDIWRRFPGLHRHLMQYPDVASSGATDILYWSKEKMGRKPVVSVTHLAIVPAPGDSPAEYAIASRNLYGSHYLDASLSVTILARDGTTTAPATYVVYVNRSRVDVFGGVFGGLVRKIVTSKARGAVADLLTGLQRRLEAQFAAGHP